MQIKDFEELEQQLNDVGCALGIIKSLSKMLLDCFCENENIDKSDIQSLTSVLNDRIIELKEKFNLIEKELSI